MKNSENNQLKCYYVTNRREYVIGFVYAETVGAAKKIGLDKDPSGAAAWVDIRAQRCKGLDDKLNKLKPIKTSKGGYFVDLEDENTKALKELLHAHEFAGAVYFHKEKYEDPKMCIYDN